MHRNQTIQHRLGRHSRLSLALGLALSLGAGSLVAAEASTSWADSSVQPTSRHLQALRDSVTSGAMAEAGSTTAAKSAMAQIWTVSSCGDTGPGTLRAIVDNFAADGDTIDLTECKQVVLQSSIVTSIDNLTLKGDLSDSNNKYGVINGNGSVLPLKHLGSGTLTLDNIMVRFGYNAGPSGGCILSHGSVHLKESQVKYCTVKNTAGNAWGGGVDAFDDVFLESSSVFGNEAIGSTGAYGGGVYAGGNVSMGFAKYNEIKNNTATVTGSSGGAKGGGIYAVGNLTDISGSLFIGNSATATATGNVNAGGGGLWVGNKATLGQSVFDGNTTNGKGGGLWVDGDLNAVQLTVTDNKAMRGGGMHVGSEAKITDSTIARNDATITGGGLSLYGDVTLSGSTISSNTSLHVAGIRMIGTNATAPLKINQSTISGNKASSSSWGSGLYLKHDAIIKNSTITANEAITSSTSSFGAGISLASGVNLDLSSNIVSGNIYWVARASGPGPALMSHSAIGTAVGATGATLAGSFNVLGNLGSGLSAPYATLTNVDPKLGPLQNHGGVTLTHLPLEDSDALGWGLENGFTYDQRGNGYPRKASGATFPDAGAIESLPWDDIIFRNGFD